MLRDYYQDQEDYIQYLVALKVKVYYQDGKYCHVAIKVRAFIRTEKTVLFP
jgi:hypothetical protein